MSYEKAIACYQGKNAERRMNCAESVVCGFQEECGITGEIMEEFRNYGGGRAPEGLCGSYYAVTVLLEKLHAADKIEGLKEEFVKDAGSVLCKEIRQNRKLNCLSCVEKSASYLDAVLNAETR